MRVPSIIAALCVLSFSRVGAQSQASASPHSAAADSARVAREAYGRAVDAFRARDLATAQREVDHAAAAWPTQEAYVWSSARVAARAGDTAAVLHALGSYASLGLGRDARADTAIARYLAAPRFAPVVRKLDDNRAPLVRSRIVATLGDSTFWPEGMDYDPRGKRYYVASVRHRTIAELTPGQAPRELWPRSLPDVGAVLGVRVDTARGVLWATMAGLPQMEGFAGADSTIAALVRVRIADGHIERRWDLAPVAGGHVLGDVAIGPRGDVFVTDSNEPVLYRLRPGSDSLERFSDPLFHSLQGLAPTADGRTLYLADYSHGLLRVDLERHIVTRLEDALGSTSLGCDGIAWDARSGAIIAVQNGVEPARVMRFQLDDSGRRIVRAEVLDRNSPIADEPTIGAIVGREFVYVANSQWMKYGEDGKLMPGAVLRAPRLLEVPLP
jgi:sugar lactone lactonase YvrE